MTSNKRLLALLLSSSILCFPAPLFAQTAQDLETARELNKEGKELRAQGKVEAALAKFKAAHDLGHTPVTGIELARTHVLLGHLVEAREVCLGISRMPIAADETERSATARVEAQKLAEDLKPRIPALRVKLRGVPQGSRAAVSVDGEALPAAMIDEPFKVNPGKHEVVAKIDGGAEVRTSVEVREAESRDVNVEVPPLAILPPPSPPPVAYLPPPSASPAPSPTAPERPAPAKNHLATIGFAIGGAGIAVGALAGITAMSKSSTLESSCPNKQCGPSAYDDLDAAKSWGTIATVAFGVGALGLAVGVYALASPKPAAKSGAFVAPSVGLGTVGLHGAF